GVSSTLTPLALLCGFGSKVLGVPDAAPRARYMPDLVCLPDGGVEIKMVDGAEVATDQGTDRGILPLVESLRAKGILDPLNRTDLSANVYESDTRELCLFADRRQFFLNTPRSQGVCLPNGPVTGSVGEIEVENRGACMTLLLAALGSDPISRSRRLLLILSGDALNTDMTFTDETQRELVNVGKAPALVRVLDVRVKVRLPDPESWTVWALAQNGERQERLAAGVDAGALQVVLQTGRLKHGPTAYFELVR
ncbi:MAG: hypothetical protein WCQ44_00490, partial [Opitutaceae bacterium]